MKETVSRITALEARVKELEREAEKRAETIRLAFQADVEKKARIVKLEAENVRLKREVEVLRQYGNKDCTAMADAVLAEKATERSEGTSEEVASLRRIRDAATLIRDSVDAAEFEGLYSVIQETADSRLKDLLERRCFCHLADLRATLAAHAAKFGEGK